MPTWLAIQATWAWRHSTTRGESCPLKIKPTRPGSNYAVTGPYFYDNDVIETVKSVQPSVCDEREITSVNLAYLRRGGIRVERFGRGSAWFDTGTYQSMFDAVNFVETIETHQGQKIACVEEVAWRMGYVGTKQLERLAQPLLKSDLRPVPAGPSQARLLRGGGAFRQRP